MSTLRLAEHEALPGVTIAEVWHDGRLVATVYPHHDGAGVLVMSKHPLSAVVLQDSLATAEVLVDPAR